MTDEHSCGFHCQRPACVDARAREWEEQRKLIATLRAQREDAFNDYNRCVDDVHAARERIAELEAENAAWREKAQVWMASPEAQKQLAGYRELGDKCASLEAERYALKAELKALRQGIVSAINGKPCPTPAQWAQMQAAIDAAKGE